MLKQIHSPSFEVTEPIRSHIHTNLEKIEHQQDRITRVDVYLKKERFQYVAEFSLSIPQHGELIVSSSSDDLYHAITEATNKSLLKLKKVREKDKSHNHKRIELE